MQGLLGTYANPAGGLQHGGDGDSGVQSALPCWGISLPALYWNPLGHRRDRAGETLSFLSELGVALLLFMVGLEFSLGDFCLAA